jgi:signal transduction histidine kinase
MIQPHPPSAPAITLASLGAEFDSSIVGALIEPAARARAYERAFSVLDSVPADGSGLGIAALGFATDMVLAVAIELAESPPALAELIRRIQNVSGIAPLALGREVLGATRLLLLPTAVAVEVALTMVLAFADQRAVAIFTQLPGGEIKRLAQAGELAGGARAMGTLARDLFAGGTAAAPSGQYAGVLLERRHRPPVALIAWGKASGLSECTSLLEAAIPLLSVALERDELLSRELQTSRADVATAERRLSRLRFDLHDGPQQDVIMLAQDLRLFASQIASVIGGSEHGEIVMGRFDDLQARLVTIDGDMRRIAAFVQSPFMRSEPFPETLSQLTATFEERTGIEPAVELHGDFGALTDSQQIALLGLIRESLSNIREHSEASHVAIGLVADVGGVTGSVTDDGRGFDPERMLIKAARDGHLGLVGMYERVRLLGGVTHIDSRPGGPTVISVSLPPGPTLERRLGEAVR